MRRISTVFALAAFTAGCSDAPTTPLSEVSRENATSPGSHGNPSHPAGAAAASETIYAVTSGNQLITFQSGSGTVTSSVQISGLVAGESIVGIDFRPSDLNTGDGIDNVGKLYAVSSAGRVYIINPATGAFTFHTRLVTATGALVDLSGTSFGVGFNPTVDRLRIHSDADQNLRVNVDNGVTIVDGTLAYTAGDPNSGRNPTVTGTGYTNNDADTHTGTELYGIDAGLDILIEFGAASATTGPNSGQLLTVGSLGVDTEIFVGFDISNATQTAYAALRVGHGHGSTGAAQLYSVNLDTGAATLIGALPATSAPIVGIAVAP